MFETFKSLLRAPAPGIDIAEGGSRIAVHVEQIGYEHAHLTETEVTLLDQLVKDTARTARAPPLSRSLIKLALRSAAGDASASNVCGDA